MTGSNETPEVLSQQPSRGGRTFAVAALATGLVVGGIAVAAVTSRDGTSDTVQLTTAPASGGFGQDAQQGQSAPQGLGDFGGDGPRGPVGPAGKYWRGVLHGELVVPAPNGTGTRTIVVQSGQVTAVSAKSLSVKSTDGFSATYVVNSATRVRAGSTGISSIKVGATVSVAATKSGSTLTALMVGDRSQAKQLHGNGQQKQQRRPSATPSPSSTA